MAVSKLIRRATIPLVAGISLYIYDTRFNYSVLTRSLKTLTTALIVTIDYKLNFNSDNSNVSSVHSRTAERVYNLCRDNGGLYIKVRIF